MHTERFIPFYEFTLQWPQPGAETALLGAFMLLGVLSLLYALPERRPGDLLATLLHVAGGLLAVTAADMITLLLGWELMTFSAFFIIARQRRAGAMRSALRYLVAHMASAALFFIGAVWHWQTVGSLAVAPAAPGAQPFFLVAVLIKTATIPFHFWLVDAYPKASYAGSVLLSVYATKVGVFTAARLVRLSVLGQPLLAHVGAVVAVGAVLCALRQHNARKLLSYHIVSQVGYMLAGVGLMTATTESCLGVEAGLFHTVNNLVYKSLLLMVAGVVCRQFGHDNLHRMGGGARHMPVTFVVALIAAAAIAGVPPSAGYASKELLKHAAAQPLIPWLLSLASVGTALSFIKFIHLIFLRRPSAPLPPLKDPPAIQMAPMLVLAALCLVNGLHPEWILPGIEHDYYAPGALAFGLLPPLLAFLIWPAARHKLLNAAEQPRNQAVRWTVGFERSIPAFFPPLRAAHNIHPQSIMMLLFVFWCALAFWLGLGR